MYMCIPLYKGAEYWFVVWFFGIFVGWFGFLRLVKK